MEKLFESCTLCPRKCKVNRNNNELGYCRAGNKMKIGGYHLHMWEEPVLTGDKGSGTIFFSYCSLRCIYCQNYDISINNVGEEITVARLADICLELQNKEATNINLVTPTHYIPLIREALILAKEQGLSIPIIYNSSGYESVESLKLLDGLIDVYLPDFKYFNNKYAVKYSSAPYYLENIMPVLKEMVSQTKELKFNEKGLIEKGVIIRHLMLPGLLFDSKKVIDRIYNTFGDKVYISLMNQYIPMYNASNYPEINKKLNPKHYDSLIDYAANIGVVNGFIQDEGSNSTEFVPDFNLQGVLKK